MTERLARLAVIEKPAKDAFGDAEVARAWLRAENIGLGGCTPLSILETDIGSRQGPYQNNLGQALRSLGARGLGTTRLEEALVAFRAALEELPRDRVPFDWAMTQDNLANALASLGDRESDTEQLEEAVAAYQAALEERTRERVPLAWAQTQYNLGGTLLNLGACETGTKRLDEALAAFRAALEVRTREHVPLHWAATQVPLGSALSSLGERESDTERLEEAVVAYHSAFEELTPIGRRSPEPWRRTISVSPCLTSERASQASSGLKMR